MKNMFRVAEEFVQTVSPEKFFVVTALAFGLLLVLLIPPFQGSDEPLHFYRAYQISQFNLVVDSNVGDDFGGMLPVSLSNTVAYTTYNSSLGNLALNQKYSLHRTKHVLSYKTNSKVTTWTNFTATALYPPVAYLPQTAGVLLARLLRLPPIVMMYAGRLANLLAWVILIALSVKLMPRKKWAMVFVGLIPVALFQAATLNADVMTIGLSAVFVAGIFYLIDRKRPITSQEFFGMLVAIGLLALCKQIMIALTPLVLLLPNNLFKSKQRAYQLKAALIAIPILIYGAWLYVIRDLNLKSVFSHHQNPRMQIHHVLTHPPGFIATLWHTYFSGFGDTIVHSFMGTFGWGEPSLPEAVVIIGYVGLFLLIAAGPLGRATRWTTDRQKMTVAVTAVLYWLAVSAALYTYYNPVGGHVINGLQGRYFLPLAVLAIPLFYGNWLKMSERAYKYIAVLAPMFLLLDTVYTIMTRYY